VGEKILETLEMFYNHKHVNYMLYI
jgi:hypothetical protein